MDNYKIYNNRYESHTDSYNYSGGIRWAFGLIKDITKYCDKSSVKNILDVGCGNGVKSILLANYFSNAKVLGIDFTDEGIKKANANYSKVNNIHFEKADIFEIQTEKYDMVSCLEVLEHIEDWQSILKKICDTSNKYVLISVPTGRMRDYEKYVGHLRNFKKGEIENFMADNGFKKIKTFYAGFPFHSPLGRDWLNKNWKGYEEDISGIFTKKQKIFHTIVYIVFRYFCFKNIGDNFVGLFEKF